MSGLADEPMHFDDRRLLGGVAVQCVDVTHVYATADAEVTALRDVSFTVPAGGRLAVVGPSGSGKSTLLTLLAGLHRPTAGEIRIGADDIARLHERDLIALRGTRMATVVQNPGRNLLPYGTTEDNIRFAQRPIPRRQRAGLPQPAELLERLGLADLAGHRVARLSGGEQQRLSIAVGLARSPGLLLLDEPTSQLDTVSRDRVVALIGRLTEASGCTVVAVTHDPAVADALGSSIALADGRVVPEDER